MLKLIYLFFISFVPFGLYLPSIQLFTSYRGYLFDCFKHYYKAFYCVMLCCWLFCIIVYVAYMCVLYYCVRLNKSMNLLTALKLFLPCSSASAAHHLNQTFSKMV